jgi:hypothetical protein
MAVRSMLLRAFLGARIEEGRARLPEWGASCYFAGGLAAARGRGRNAIFDGLDRRKIRPIEPIAALVEDPWRAFDYDDLGEGCAVSSLDLRFAVAGHCIQARSRVASGLEFDPDGECLAPVSECAWSSPIFVEPFAASGT